VLYNKRKAVSRCMTDDSGLGDAGIDDDDAELVAAIRALPTEAPLPPHLSEFDRKKSLTQIEVSSSNLVRR
jgi:hypothetical protein